MKEINTNQIKKGTGIAYLSIIANCVFTIVLTPFIIRKIGSGQYGIYRTISAVMSYMTICKFGLGSAAVRYIAECRIYNNKKQESELLAVLKLLNIFICIFSGIIGFALYKYIPAIFAKGMHVQEIETAKGLFTVMVVSVIITLINDIYDAVITAYERYFFQKSIELARNIIRTMLIISLLMIYPSAMWLGVVDILLNIIVLGINIVKCKKLNINFAIRKNLNYKNIDKLYYKKVITFALYIMLNTIINQMIWNTDAIIIGMRLSTMEAAVYGVGATISNVFYTLSTVIANLLVPLAVTLVSNNKGRDELNRVFIKIGRYQAFIIFFLISAYWVMGKQFILLWMGENYIEAWSSSLLVMLGTVFASLVVAGHAILKALNRQRFFLFSYFAVLFLNIILTYYVTPIWGIIGAAFVTFITFTIVNIFMIYPYYQICIGLNIKKLFASLFQGIIPTSVITSYLFIKLFSEWNCNSWFIFFGQCIIYCLVFFTGMWIFCLKTKEKNKIRNILYTMIHINKR